ncbi:MAG: type II toxin-antitoxin system RelE/ParE family toxin [Sphingomonadales bacterium]|nr:type II toxin-antitoxin system RelE/ParE family toxin [Porphyrobacter sp.]MBY0343513.1 type II toxin-antitoxin system RelE/ParE family toxin [Sphingomonadales bacterium]
MPSARFEVRIAAGAERDLEGIYRRRKAQRGEDGPDGADTLLNELVGAVESLAGHPAKGPVVPELAELGIADYRQLSRAPFRIIYMLDADCVTVLIVADARRDFRTLLAERVLG